MTISKTQRLYKQAKRIIPGGTQLLSKRPEMFLPNYWPAYYKKAQGCEVIDLDNRRYLDMSFMGLGSCILGYAAKSVDREVLKVIKSGSMSTLNAPEEVELARLMLKLHPWAEMVRYARTGGEAMAIAIRIARAKTQKDVVLFCGYHGWHDWYLSANLSSNTALDGHLLVGLNPLGVPRKLKGTSFPFTYNDANSFLKLVKKYKNRIGVIVLESIRNRYPSKEFISTIKGVCSANNIVLIIDEITAGFRLNKGGAHLLLGFEPDIAVFAKGISNGFPMAIIIGKKNVMSCAHDSFISSTYWTERIGPTAALATLREILNNNVPEHLIKIGKKVQLGWQNLAKRNKIDIEVSGIPPLGHFIFKYNKPLVLKTLFTQIMLDEGFLATTAFYASYAHKQNHIERYLNSVNIAFKKIFKYISSGKPEHYLKGPVCHSGFKRLT